jgi:hypothetical protein
MSETESRTVTNRSSQSTSQSSGNEDVENVRVEEVPWSELAQEFAETWGRADPKDPQPEHVEDIGPTGSGKTLIVCKMVQERGIVRKTPCVIITTKPADGTVMKLGWPVIQDGDVSKVKKARWAIFWPNTNATGRARKLYQADKIRDLLNSLWHAESNIIVVFDDFGYIQELVTSDREPLAPIVQMYLREGRSAGITCVLIKQRPQGSRREMHSETQWTIAFPPKDKDDQERYAELFGDKKTYMAIFDQMDADKHQFLIKHARSGAVFISWVDTPLRPVKMPDRDAKQRP